MLKQSKIQGPRDLVAILYRRKWHLLIPAFVLFAVSCFVALTWPPTYQSKATILLEEPDVSGDIVGSTEVSRGDQTVQIISQRVLTRENLIKLIETLNIYPEIRKKDKLAGAAEGMRKNIIIEFISAEVSDPRMRLPGLSTIAFSLGFNHKDPQISQLVVEKLVSLFLAENLRSRREKASETTDFLTKEADKLRQHISELEVQLAAFKLENSGNLPEQASFNQQAMNQMQLQLADLRSQIQSQEEKKVYLESQLRQVSPYASITLDDGTVLRPEERLRMLEAQYSKLSYTYGPKHPKMVAISTEIKTLKENLGLGENGLPEKPSNPAYLQLEAELKTISSNLKSLESERSYRSDEFETLKRRMLRAPEIEREYLVMTRDYENAREEYRTVKEKVSEAERLKSLESEQKGLRFSVVEPPQVPLKPISPNRPLILVLGFMISVFGSVGAVGLAELMDQSISSLRELAAIDGAKPLVVIPYIEATSVANTPRSSRAFLHFLPQLSSTR